MIPNSTGAGSALLKINVVVVVLDHQVPDHDQDQDHVPAAVHARVQGAVAALVVIVAAAAAPSRGHIQNPNQSPNPSLLSTVAHVPSPNQGTAQSPSLSQRANQGPALGLRMTDPNLDLNQNRKLSKKTVLHQVSKKKNQEIVANVQGMTDLDQHQVVDIARAVVAQPPL
jgi:hypothetical protein